MTEKDSSRKQLDRKRYRRVLFFFGKVTLHIIWWEMILSRIPGKRFARRGRPDRLQRYARDFRHLAVAMGGVMIKLGQFVSSRVDVIPQEITQELSGLQDEVPPEKLENILSVIKAELGAPPDQVFAEFDTGVIAAASLGQVYRAKLTSGEQVVVKVQRPEIERMVATDLAALKVVARWMMIWSLIRNRADVPALMDEFAVTLWEELDYESEANNADRFRELFAHDHGVYIPAIYRETSTKCVLTLEDVTSIKITDHAAIEAAGVDRRIVARRLLDIYLRMIFEYDFFHADPHPGNLFVYPLPETEPVASNEAGVSRPFYIVFVDFGMVGRISGTVREGLRETLIAVGTRDSKRLLAAYQKLGVLLPSADLERIEEAEAEILDFIWGKSVPELAQMPHSEMGEFALKYRDLLYEMPFQVPQNFIYLARAVGTLSGICTGLDQEFNPWEPIANYAQKLLSQESGFNVQMLIDEAFSLGQLAISLPRQLDNVLGRMQRGAVEVQIKPARSLQEDLFRIESAVNGLTRAVIFVGLLASSTFLYLNNQVIPASIGAGMAGLTWLSIIFRRRKPRK